MLAILRIGMGWHATFYVKPRTTARRRATMEKLLHSLIPGILIGAAVTIFSWFEPFSTEPRSGYALELDLTSAVSGSIQVICEGEVRSFTRANQKVATAEVHAGRRESSRYYLAAGHYTEIAVCAPSQPGELTIHGARILDAQGNEFRQLSPELFVPTRAHAAIASPDIPSPSGGGAMLSFAGPIVLPSQVGPAWALIQGATAALLTGLLLWKFDAALLARRRQWCAALAAATARRPVLTLAAVAVVATLAACHPVIFFGKSYTSPNNGASGLYPWLPLPVDGHPGKIEKGKGSDIGALTWALFPYAVVEHRAIFHDHEVPLWNRYSGFPLLGQAQSMLGDPLHWMAICAGGAPWAWDVRFVIARFLFAFGIGLLVRAVTGRLGIAALLGASSAFIGFFAYRAAHPACFTMGYAPWVLLGWWSLARAESWRAAAPGGALLILSNWCTLNSGTAKESVMLIGCLSATGALAVMFLANDARMRWQRLAAGGAAMLLFALLSAPCWLVFLDALSRACSVYDHPPTFQISPPLLIGLFDELFYRQTAPAEMHSNPSANFLVLLGVLWAAAAARRLRADGGARALALSLVPPFLFAFSVVPDSLIESLPFFRNISHIDNTFSCVLIVLLFPLAGLGLRACLTARSGSQWRREALKVAAFAAALLVLYFGFTQAHLRVGSSPAEIPPFPEKSAFFAGYAPALFIALAALLWTGCAWRRGATLGPILAASLALVAIHFRHGMYLETRFDDYVFNPQDRIDILAPSPSVEAIRRTQAEPTRVFGIGPVLACGFHAALGLEKPAHADPLVSPYWREFMERANVIIMWGWRVVVRKADLGPLQPFLDFLNVRYYLGVPGELPPTPPSYRSLGSMDLEVLTSPTAWPRAFFADSLTRYRTGQEFVELVARGDGRPFAAVAENESGAPQLPLTSPARRIVPATAYRLTNNTTEFTVEAPGPGLAVLGEIFEAGCFHATVNGQPAETFRANHMFKAVALPRAGRYVIRFTYEPPVWKTALALCGVGVVLSLIAGVAWWRSRSLATHSEADFGALPSLLLKPQQDALVNQS